MVVNRRPAAPGTGRQLSDALARSVYTCADCGFADTILKGEWIVRTGRDDRTGHLVYRLDCPDCAAVEMVRTNIP